MASINGVIASGCTTRDTFKDKNDKDLIRMGDRGTALAGSSARLVATRIQLPVCGYRVFTLAR